MGRATIQPVPSDVDAEDWPRRDDVPYLYGCTSQMVAALLRQKRLHPYEDGTGVIRFKPAQLERWLGPRKDVPAPGAAEDAAPTTTLSAVEMLLREMSDLFRTERTARVADNKQAAAEREKLLELVTAPAVQLQTLVRETVADMRAELLKLRENEMRTFAAYQNLLDQTTARDLEVMTATKREERRDRAAVQLQPHVLGILRKLGVSTVEGDAVAQLARVRDLVGSIDIGMLKILLEDPGITDEQRHVIEGLRPELKTPPTNGVAS